jgi:hypothetical protein
VPAMLAATGSALQQHTPDRVHDAPACMLAALIDSLTSPERYSLEVRNGELFIAPALGCGETWLPQLTASGGRAVTGFSGC